MAKSTAAFRCSECGWQAPKWVGRCGECQAWGTVAEAAVPRLVRAGLHASREMLAVGFVKRPGLLRGAQRIALRHLARAVPDPDLRARLTVLAERPADALDPVGRVDDEGGGGDVGAAAGAVRPHLGRADDPSALDRDDGAAGGLLHPPGACFFEGLALGERVRPALVHDRRVEGVDAGPVFFGGYADLHRCRVPGSPGGVTRVFAAPG